MNRRDFMKTTVLAGAATAAARRAAARPVAPTDRIRVGFLGTGARAQEIMGSVAAYPGAEIVAVCDAYQGRVERALARTGGRAQAFPEYQAILARPDVDAVVIATPDHWHARMSVDALRAGKDVYLEKPMSHSIDDGLAIAAAVRETGRILQVGSQGVSSPLTEKAREIVKAGRLGQITMFRAAFNRNGRSGAWLYPIPPDATPRTVDWDAFLGPAPKRPFDLERFFRWRCYWDYSGGIATDLFVHLVSELHHLTDARAPASVAATGATYRFTGTHEVPDTVNALLMYPEGFTANLLCTFNNAEGADGAMELLGTDGSLILRGSELEFRPERVREDNRWVVRSWPEALERAYYDTPEVQQVESPWLRDATVAGGSQSWVLEGRDDTYTHVAAFFEAVRTRTQPVEDARFGHRAAACAHMINQSLRERRMVEWDRRWEPA